MRCVDRLSASDLAGYLDGDLPAEVRDRVEAHLDACPDCWNDLLDVRELRDAPTPRALAPKHHRVRWLRYAGIAAAAGLAGIVLVGRGIQRDAPSGTEPLRTPSTETTPSSAMLSIVAPVEGATLTPASLTFTWRAVTAGFYRFTLLTETGEPAWTTETTDTVLRLPSYLTLEPGLYFWRVDAVQDGLTASSGIHRLRIVP